MSAFSILADEDKVGSSWFDGWLSYLALADCAVLEDWIRNGGDGPEDLVNSVAV